MAAFDVHPWSAAKPNGIIDDRLDSEHRNDRAKDAIAGDNIPRLVTANAARLDYSPHG